MFRSYKLLYKTKLAKKLNQKQHVNEKGLHLSFHQVVYEIFALLKILRLHCYSSLQGMLRRPPLSHNKKQHKRVKKRVE